MGQLEELSRALDFAATALRSEKGQREATRFALAAIVECLQNFNFPGSQTALLNGLFDALGDLDRGTVPSILQPVAVNERPPDPEAQRIGKVHIVAAIDVRMLLGAKLKDAASAVHNAAPAAVMALLGDAPRHGDASIAAHLVALRKNFSRSEGYGPRGGMHEFARRIIRGEIEAAAARSEPDRSAEFLRLAEGTIGLIIRQAAKLAT